MVNTQEIHRFDVFLANLDSTQGSEIQKTRPCVIISPDELNRCLKTVIIVPMTTTVRSYPTRISLTFYGKKGQIALDQIRTIDKGRLVKKLENLSPIIAKKILTTLGALFS